MGLLKLHEWMLLLTAALIFFVVWVLDSSRPAQAFEWEQIEDAVIEWWDTLPEDQRDQIFNSELADLGRDLDELEDEIRDLLGEHEGMLPVRPGVGYGQLFFLGDSVLFGALPDRTGHNAAPTLLMRQALVWNLSQNGQTLRNAVERQVWDAVWWSLDQSRSSIQSSTAVIMALGGNDAFFFGQSGLEQFREDLGTFLQRLDGLDADVFCMPIPTPSGAAVIAVPTYGDYLLELIDAAESGGCTMMPTWDWGFGPEHFDGEGVHLTVEGHRLLAARLSEFLGL